MALLQPDDLTQLVLRTDFHDDAAWETVCATLDAVGGAYSPATWVDDPRFDGVTVRALLDENGAAAEEDRIFHVFLADAATMADPACPLLAVDLSDEPGRTFRVPAEWFPTISANLSLANMDFAEYAEDADGTGTFRGFRDI